MSMRVNVELNKRSQDLIEQYIRLCPTQASELGQFTASVDMEQLIIWLYRDDSPPFELTQESKQEMDFILASLRAELLHDLFNSLAGDVPEYETEEGASSDFAAMKLVFLALAGTLLTGCEGFDSITTMLGVLSLPSILILLAGLGFALLSIVVFYSYDLIQVAQNLGVTIRDAPKLLDIYLQQMNEIKAIRKKIDSYQLATLSLEELLQLKQTVVMLQMRFQSLIDVSAQFDKVLNSPNMQRMKLVITGLAGLLFFGSGFFAGQSVAMFVASIFLETVLPTFWPVILFSVLVGIAAFALYWYLENEGLNRLVSGWFGLDEDKVEQLCDRNKLDKEQHKLELLQEKIISTARLVGHFDALQDQVMQAEGIQPCDTSIQKAPVTTQKIANNIYSFHAQLKETINTPLQEDIGSSDTLSASCK